MTRSTSIAALVSCGMLALPAVAEAGPMPVATGVRAMPTPAQFNAIARPGIGLPNPLSNPLFAQEYYWHRLYPNMPWYPVPPVNPYVGPVNPYPYVNPYARPLGTGYVSSPYASPYANPYLNSYAAPAAIAPTTVPAPTLVPVPAPVAAAPAPTTPPAPTANLTSLAATKDIRVNVPDPFAKVIINGKTMTGIGRERVVPVAGVATGNAPGYTVTAVWEQDGRTVSRQKSVELDPDGHGIADFR